MATKYLISTLAGYAAGIAAMVVLLIAVSVPSQGHQAAQQVQHAQLFAYDDEGYAAAKARRQEPDAIEAAFPQESYRPGSIATLRLWMRPAGTTVRIYRVGPEPQLTIGDKTMEGVAMTQPQRVRAVRRRSAAARGASGCSRPPHPHLAGVQLPRRRPRRRRGHVVRDVGSVPGAARQAVSEPRRSAPLPHLRPALPALARPDRARRGRALAGRARRRERRRARAGL